MYIPPGIFRSRSFTRFTTRVGLLHLGQSVDLVVSMIFLRSPVFAILAIFGCFSLWCCLCSRAQRLHTASTPSLHTCRHALREAKAQDSLFSVYMNAGCQVSGRLELPPATAAADWTALFATVRSRAESAESVGWLQARSFSASSGPAAAHRDSCLTLCLVRCPGLS